MREMTAADNVHTLVTRAKAMKGKQIHSLTDGERRLLKYLMDEGLY